MRAHGSSPAASPLPSTRMPSPSTKTPAKSGAASLRPIASPHARELACVTPSDWVTATRVPSKLIEAATTVFPRSNSPPRIVAVALPPITCALG